MFKDSEGSGNVMYLQANYLASHSFMDAGKNKKTPGSQKKDFNSPSDINSELVPVHWALAPSEQHKEGQVTPVYTVGWAKGVKSWV